MAGPPTKGQDLKKPGATGQTPLGASAEEVHRKKVDDAFDLMEKLENNSAPANAESGADSSNRKNKNQQASQSGIRIRFGVDALVTASDTRAAREKDIRPGEATLLDVGFTLPYIWRVPVVGKAALKLIKHFQKEDRPKSVRDILKSLRQKSE